MKKNSDIVLTHRRCGYLLVVSCFVYFIFNSYILIQGLASALSGAVASTIAFGLMVYFVKIVSNDFKKEKL